MLRLIFTLDYEIHGDGQGCPQALMVEPTDRLLALFDEFGAKLTIMADVAEILRFRQHDRRHGQDRFHARDIEEQLRRAVATGHDVQLHLHSSYFNARFEGGRWAQDWREYDFARLPRERMRWMVRTGKEYLESLLRPVDPGYRCVAFRAANWSVNPAHNVVSALLENGMCIDTSVFKYGRRSGLVNFDYAHAHSEIEPWPASPDDLCVRDDASRLWEVPIYSERRWVGAFVSPGRVLRALAGWHHKVAREAGAALAATASPHEPEPNAGKPHRVSTLFGRHAWKADFNQCSGRQLIGALHRAERHAAPPGGRATPFVLIGHSKLCTRINEPGVRRLLEHAARRPERFEFGTLDMAIPSPVPRFQTAAA